MDFSMNVDGNMEPQTKPPKSPINFSTLINKFPGSWELIQTIKTQIRPWSEFLNTQNFKVISNFQRLTGRTIRNLTYFQSNYLCVFLLLMIYCLITSPLLLIVICGVFYICHRLKQSNLSVQIFGYELNSYQQCLIINVATIPVLYIIGAGSIMFWVLGASCFVVTIHATFYNIEAIVTEDTEGFLTEII